ncbi:MAG: ADOP family duplicated permease [Verrucomicrobiota bacterium]
MSDLRYALRQLLKHPGFTLVTVLSLALGLAVNTAVFTFFNAMNLRPIPGVKEPGRIVFSDRSYWYFSHTEFEHIRGKSSVFSHVAGISRARVVAREGTETEAAAEPARVLMVSRDYFEALGADAPLGRYFLGDEHQRTGETGVAVVSHECWERRFASDPRLIGRTVLLNGAAFTVVGIGPESFPGAEPFFAQRTDFWVPLMSQPLLQPGKSIVGDASQKRIQWFARLKPDVTLRQAQAEMAVMEEQLASAFPEKVSGGDVRSRQRWSGNLTAGYRFRLLEGEELRLALLVQCISIVVLLVACANGANLLLARAAARTRELGIRVALGAGRGRLLRQLLTESVVLGVLAGTAGLMLSTWSCGLLRGFLLGEVNQYSQAQTPLLDLRPDLRILLFTLGLSATAGLVVGWLPALRASRPDLANNALKGEMPGTALGLRPSRWRDATIVSQFTVSLLLLVVAGLLVKIAWQGIHREYRTDLSRVMLVEVDYWSKGFEPARISQSQADLVRQAPLMPGIEAAALISHLHPRDYHEPPALLADDAHEPADVHGLSPFPSRVTPEFFETMGMPILQGRAFTGDDTAAVIVSKTLAQRLWPGRSAIGRRLKVGENGAFAEVVGVVSSAFDSSVYEHAPSPARYTIAGFGSDVFLPWRHDSRLEEPRALLLVRHDGRNALATSAMAVAAQSLVAADVAVYTRPLRDLFEYWMKPFLLFARLGGILGALALLLAAVGLHGMIAGMVSQRTREIGVRMALGASRRQVLWLVLRQSAVLVLWATAIGLTLAAGAAFALRAGIYGVLVWDPIVYLGPAALLGIVALVASILPARNATRVDPMVALRHE